MPDARNDHPYANLFLGVYAELLLRGAWAPKLDDPALPAGVWINFNEFEAVARSNRLQFPPALFLIRALQPSRIGPARYPRVLHQRPLAGPHRGKEHYVELHHPMNPWGLYAPTPEAIARYPTDERQRLAEAFGAVAPSPRPGEAPDELVIAC
ncbi:hypothetical protein ACQKIE_18800 [Luteibacter sp. NPDC031894]|uniref:hypothetical protein n=1 Tax=Luteibacter sp. NPDC031894 TaxID=3390572 RepID=UPI003D032939